MLTLIFKDMKLKKNIIMVLEKNNARIGLKLTDILNKYENIKETILRL